MALDVPWWSLCCLAHGRVLIFVGDSFTEQLCEGVSNENYLIACESDISFTKILLSDNIKC